MLKRVASYLLVALLGVVCLILLTSRELTFRFSGDLHFYDQIEISVLDTSFGGIYRARMLNKRTEIANCTGFFTGSDIQKLAYANFETLRDDATLKRVTAQLVRNALE